MTEPIAQPIQLVIFDLDGVLVDSEPLHDAAKHHVLARLGIHQRFDLSRTVGYPLRELWLRFIHEYSIPQTPETLEKMQYDSILDQMRDKQIGLSNGLPGLLTLLKRNGLRLAVASSSNRYYVDRVLDYYQISDWFEVVVGGDEVPRKKPAPDGYLRALELAGVPAANAIAIEDSEAGSMAAKSAGITCIGYRNPTSGIQNLAHADRVVESLEEVPTLLFP